MANYEPILVNRTSGLVTAPVASAVIFPSGVTVTIKNTGSIQGVLSAAAVLANIGDVSGSVTGAVSGSVLRKGGTNWHDTTRIRITGGNVRFFGAANDANASGSIFIANRTAAIASAPTSGVHLYASGGALYCIGSGGTTTKIASA